MSDNSFHTCHQHVPVLGLMNQLELKITPLHASTYKGLAGPKRLLILNVLRESEMAVMDICETLNLPQVNVAR